MADYDIFRDQLAIRFPGHGHALLEPSPGDLCDVVEVGDVGYINQGRFHRLFNILLPADHPSHANFGVPANHKQFEPKVPNHIISGILRRDNFCSAGVALESDGQFATRPRDPGEVTFSCRLKQGAVLSLPIEATRKNTVVREGFAKWMVKHIDQWFAWIQDREFEIGQMEDIILVTGTDRSQSSANIAFLGGQADAQVSFGVEATRSKINWQFSPERKTGAAWNWGPSGEDLPQDQCIFIRGFRVRKRIIWWPRLRAAAEPNPDPKHDNGEPEVELLSVPAVPEYRDPLHVILGYISEERPNCGVAIVHDDDLALLNLYSDDAPPEALGPDVVLRRLRGSRPVIHEVVLGPEPTSGNNSADADPEIVRVGSLSATFEDRSDSKGGCMIATPTLRSPLLISETRAIGTTSWHPSTSNTSQTISTGQSSTKFDAILAATLKEYKKQTKRDITSNPLATQLHSCESPGAIIEVLRIQVHPFNQSQNADERLTRWLGPTVHVLFVFSETLGNGIGQIFPPLNALFAGIGVLLQAINNVHAGRDALIDLFGRLENHFRRLDVYTAVTPTAAMTDITVKIMVEVLLILGIVTKEIGQGRARKFLKTLFGKKGVEKELQRLDKLTQEVAEMAAAETLTLAYRTQADSVLKDVDHGDTVDIDSTVRSITDTLVPQEPDATPLPAKPVHPDRTVPVLMRPQSETKPSIKPPPRSRSNFPPVSPGISRTTSALHFDGPTRGDRQIFEGETSWKLLPETSSSIPSSSTSRPIARSASMDTHNARYGASRMPPSSFGSSGRVGQGLEFRARPRADPKRTATTGHNTTNSFLPTVREVLPDGFRFRILVLGKRHSGKSSLIKTVFSVDLAASSGSQHGNTDINASFTPDNNQYLVVHEYSGFEPGDAQSLQTIRHFISNHTDARRPVSERLHAIWICVPMSDAIERGLGEGVKMILGLNKVPVLIVFTKFDQLVYRVQFDNTQGNSDPGARAHAMYGDLCRSLFDREPKDWPAVIFSERQGYSGLIDGLTSTTHEFIRAALPNSTDRPTSSQGQSPVPPMPALLGWSIAQRVNHHITIQASIEVGRYRYWRNLGSSQAFTGQTLESCVKVIREDIINVWNFEDTEKYLLSRDFTTSMTSLVGDQATSKPTTQRQWTNDTYKNSHENIRCIMAYIVDLTVILNGLFISSHSVSATEVQSAMKNYAKTSAWSQIHTEIRSFVAEMPFTYHERDTIMEKIIDLITQNCIPTSGQY